MLEVWRHAVGDPDTGVVQWLLKAAPAGIEVVAPAAGIFPECDTNDMSPIDAVATDELMFTSYHEAEPHDATQAELSAHINQGHIFAADSFEALEQWLGDRPVLNNLGLMLKMRDGKVEARMILDTKQSNIKQIIAESQRVILPRRLDVVYDVDGCCCICLIK